jgi:hypothetical protein
MIAVKISCQLFHYFIILVCWVSCWIGSLRITYIHKYIVSCTFIYRLYIYTTYYSMYMSGGGGRTSTYFPAEELRASVLSVQCVASTCVRVGMG